MLEKMMCCTLKPIIQGLQVITSIPFSVTKSIFLWFTWHRTVWREFVCINVSCTVNVATQSIASFHHQVQLETSKGVGDLAAIRETARIGGCRWAHRGLWRQRSVARSLRLDPGNRKSPGRSRRTCCMTSGTDLFTLFICNLDNTFSIFPLCSEPNHSNLTRG